MLTLILGPSGSGKTTIIESLVKLRGWVPIPSYITRPPRLDDKYKYSISDTAYAGLRAANELWSDVSQLNFSYGTLRQDIESALSDTGRQHVLDFSFRTRAEFFGSTSHVAIALIPESAGELARRLTEGGRPGRLGQALSDLSEITAMAKVNDPSAPILVVNERDRLAQAMAEIEEIVVRGRLTAS